jgi:hypothetical protein
MLRRTAVCGALLAVIGTGVASSVAAQSGREMTHHGLTWSLGFGKGSLKVTCSLACDEQKTNATGLVGRVGWTLRQNLVVGVDAVLWEKAQDIDGDLDNDNVKFNYAGASLQFYPHPFRQFFVKIAAGMGQTKTEMDVPTFGPRRVSATGFGGSVGTGYDFHVGKGFSITPYIDYLGGFKGKGDLDGASSDVDFTSSMVQWGLKVVVH